MSSSNESEAQEAFSFDISSLMSEAKSDSTINAPQNSPTWNMRTFETRPSLDCSIVYPLCSADFLQKVAVKRWMIIANRVSKEDMQSFYRRAQENIYSLETYWTETKPVDRIITVVVFPHPFQKSELLFRLPFPSKNIIAAIPDGFFVLNHQFPYAVPHHFVY